ncbi:MAG: dTDP-6-deoxy-3,4-keto-hexulose isomerase [Flavihumibacter sp. CACIAM 22H1]|nr:MAG: dTDP-6-deoxy-3,4-keto-hexulose isomerase [Flavihumibacter sp. CACIAM 22H1]
MIHELADVQTSEIGVNTRVWQFSVILKGARIGSNCNINCHTFIENDVNIGNNVTVKSGVYLWDGITIEDDVFIGPNVTFTNDKSPRSKKYPESFQRTYIDQGASIGAAATILGGVTIGAYAMVGASALITKSVPQRALVVGHPARIVGWLNKDGTKMTEENGCFKDQDGSIWIVRNDELIKK